MPHPARRYKSPRALEGLRAFLKFKTVPHLSSSKFKFPPMRAGRAVSVSMGVSVWLAFVIFTYLFLLGDFLGIIKLLDVKIPL